MAGRILYWKQEEDNRKWQTIPDTPKARASAIRQGAMFSTWTSLSEPYKGDGHPEPIRFGDLPLDFDNASDPGQALIDLRDLCLLYLPEYYRVDPYSIQFFLSGGKGFHAVIPTWLFNAQGGDPCLPLIYKKIAFDWKERFDLKTLDMSLYCMGMGKMFRIANVKRNNGRHKVPISLEEGRDLSYNDLWKLGEAPREIDLVEVDLSPNSYLEGLFKKCRKEVYGKIEKQKTAPPVKGSPLPKKFPDCIKYILTESPKTKSTTNLLLTNLAAFFQTVGFSYDEAFNQVRSFLGSYPHSTGYTTAEARIKHFEDQWQYIGKTPKYKEFRCEYILGLGLPGSAFECKKCALHRQEIGMKIVAEQQTPNTVTTNKNEPLIFPNVIAGAAHKAVEIYRRYIEAPEQFIYMTFITLLGAVLARMVTLDTAFKVQTRLYTVLIGPTGRSRKSTVLGLIVDLFKDILTHDFKLDICWGVGSDVGLARRMKKSESLVLATDEFKALTSKSSIKSSALLPTISTLFDRNEYSNYLKSDKDSIEITDAYLTMIAASTPETFEEIWTSEFTNIGLNNRLFLVPGTGKKAPLPKNISAIEFNSIKKEVGKILGVVGGGVKLILTEEAENKYNQWYLNLEDTIHSQRLESYCLRLACILALNELKVQIDADIIQKSITLCNWQLTARRLYDHVNADNVTAKLEEKIRRQLKGRGPMTKRELIQYTNAHRAGLYFFQNALRNVKKADEVFFEKKTKKFRLKA